MVFHPAWWISKKEHKKALEIIGPILPTVPQALVSLIIKFCRIIPQITEELMKEFKKTSVDMSNSGLTTIDALAYILSKNTIVTKLDISSNPIDDAGIEILAYGIENNSTLTSLNLQKNKNIGRAGATLLFESIKQSSSLKILNTSVKLDYFKETNKSKNTVYLTHKRVDDLATIVVAGFLKNNTMLTRLDIDDNEIGDLGAKAIGDMLSLNSTLRELLLDYNKIGDIGAIAIGEGLKTNTNLQELSLSNNEINNSGAIVLGECIRVNSALQLLQLKNNKISDEGAIAIAKGIQTNSTHVITELSLLENNISEEAMISCRKFTQGIPFLKEFTLN